MDVEKHSCSDFHVYRQPIGLLNERDQVPSSHRCQNMSNLRLDRCQSSSEHERSGLRSHLARERGLCEGFWQSAIDRLSVSDVCNLDVPS
jgi:hypothetical protein